MAKLQRSTSRTFTESFNPETQPTTEPIAPKSLSCVMLAALNSQHFENMKKLITESMDAANKEQEALIMAVDAHLEARKGIAAMLSQKIAADDEMLNQMMKKVVISRP